VQSAAGWNIILREESTTLSPDPRGAEVLTFDREGRPVAWSEKGNLYKRSLASELHGRRVDDDGRHRWRIPPEEAEALLARLLARVAELPAAMLDAEVRRRIEQIRRWTPGMLLAERDRFQAAYRSLGILPPDQYLAVVLQATFGCSWNRCTFCSFYRGREFAVRTLDEFEGHLSAVRVLLGRGALLRKRIFLADGDALALSNARLLPMMEKARAVFPGRPLCGFVDVFAGLGKEAGEWEELAGAGLRRVQIGIETGDDRLLEWLNKPGTAAEARRLVEALKLAGLRVSIIFMVGVGGDRFARDHVRGTLDLVATLPLGSGDVVYLSPFLENAGSAYSARAAQEGIRPLDEGEAEAQHRAIRDGIRALRPGAKVARYDIREFVY
jgi:hypothetical protein